MAKYLQINMHPCQKLPNLVILLLDVCTKMITMDTELLAIERGCVLLHTVTMLLKDVGAYHTSAHNLTGGA